MIQAFIQSWVNRSTVFSTNILLGSLTGIILLLLTYNLAGWPATWYDEGISLQVAKNLTETGAYGLDSAEGFRPFDPLISTGPAITAPIALYFNIFGVGLLQARTVMILFSLATLYVFFQLASQIFDWQTAFIGTLLLFILPIVRADITITFLGLSRMVVGEVPATFYLLTGVFLWFQALDRPNTSKLVGAGIFFGLALLTKSVFLIFIGVIGLLAVIDRLWFKQLHWKQVVLPIALSIGIFACWQLIKSWYTPALSDEVAESNLSRFFAQALTGLINPNQIIGNIGALAQSRILVWSIPGLIYGLSISLERDLQGLKRMFFVLGGAIWLAWYLFGSIGWLRYLFPGHVLLILLAASLLRNILIEPIELRISSLSTDRGFVSQIRDWLAPAAVLMALFLVVALQLLDSIRLLSLPANDDAFRFASYLTAEIPTGARIETFESEIPFLTDHTYRQPDLSDLMLAVGHVQFGEPYPDMSSALLADDFDYLIIGNFGNETGYYAQYLAERELILEKQIGPYALYRLTPAAAGK